MAFLSLEIVGKLAIARIRIECPGPSRQASSMYADEEHGVNSDEAPPTETVSKVD